MIDADAEVIALSPTTLTAKNRFVCEVCFKGFPREQNLQLHKRGHNLPWQLKQKSSDDEVKRKVYLCPVPSCVHHDPSNALGDLTGIKKHYSRKHGEKNYKCKKCMKMYAVDSDLKVHLKTCSTKEYQCYCGTFFSRYIILFYFYFLIRRHYFYCIVKYWLPYIIPIISCYMIGFFWYMLVLRN